MDAKIGYRSGYKYQLVGDYTIQTPLIPIEDVDTDYLGLTRGGLLTIKDGYAWDGPSGPTFDTRSFMRGSLVHDACYQLLREGYMLSDMREVADRLLRDICIEDGMGVLRAWMVYNGVRIGGAPAADPAASHRIIHAPE